MQRRLFIKSMSVALGLPLWLETQTEQTKSVKTPFGSPGVPPTEPAEPAFPSGNVTRPLVPTVDNAFSLGTDFARFSAVHARQAYFSEVDVNHLSLGSISLSGELTQDGDLIVEARGKRFKIELMPANDA